MAQIVAMEFPSRDAAERALRRLQEEGVNGDGQIAPLGSTNYDAAPAGVVLAASVASERMETARAIARDHGGRVIYETRATW